MRSAPRSRRCTCGRFWEFWGVAVVGGEAYISFKPGVVDSNGIITDESTRRFLKAFIDQFTTFVARLSFPQEAAA